MDPKMMKQLIKATEENTKELKGLRRDMKKYHEKGMVVELKEPKRKSDA